MPAIQSIFVRHAVENELALVEQHRSSSRVESEKYRGVLTEHGNPAPNIVLVAGVGTTVMGSLSAQTDQTTCFISHIYVIPEAREVGLGDALLSHLIDELRTHSVQRVTSQALPGDRATKNLFERHGLIAETILVGKSL